MSNTKVIDTENDIDALKSPFSRVYLCPKFEHIIHCTMGFKNPIDLEALKKAFLNSIIIKHPRFCSLMLRNPKGQDQWKKAQVNINDHFIVPNLAKDSLDANEVEREALLNDYLSDIAVSSPLNPNKPLWEVHVLLGLNCIVLRVHHAIGDGTSLMSMLSTCFGKEKKSINKNGVNGEFNVKKIDYATRKVGAGIWVFIISLLNTFVAMFRLVWRLFWVKNEIGGDGVELWPRKIVSVKFNIEDFKYIKKAIPNVTVNDVLLGTVSCGLSKYIEQIDVKSPQALQQITRVTAIIMVNLRNNCCSLPKEKTSSSEFPLWGNKTGTIQLPIDCQNGLHALDYTRTMKATMDKKKNSFEARLSYWTLKLFTSYFGTKVASQFVYRIICNTSLLISNFKGPSQEIEIADNPVSYMRVNCSSTPHAITMHMVSYGGVAELQLMVAKDIISDPEYLAKCFQDSLIEMKNSINKKEHIP